MKLSEKKLKELKKNKISIEDLNDRYFINSQYRVEVENIKKLLNEYICSFKDIVDKVKSIKNAWNNPCLYVVLENIELFEELFENNKLNIEDLRYLLNKIDEWYELSQLCVNEPLIKYVLNEFVLDKEIDWCKRRNIHTIFGCVEHFNENNEELLKLNELNKKVYSFELTDDQRLELIGVLKNNEIAQNRLLQLIENNLEDQYDFESLKNLLMKDDKKNLKTKFNF